MPGNSPILVIPQIGEAQTNKYATHNTAVDKLEAATQARLEKTSVGAGPVNLTNAETVGYAIYEVSGGSAAFDLVFTAENADAAASQRLIVVKNLDTTYTCTVKTDADVGAFSLGPGEFAVAQVRGDDMILIARGGIDPYDLAVFVPGVMSNDQLLFQHIVTRPFTLADDFAGSQMVAGVAATATTTLDIEKNGSGIGTVQITSGGVVTFATTGSGAESFAAGDVLTILAPSSADATLADVAITLSGKRA